MKISPYFFAAENTQGFANTWGVYAFATRAARDKYVEQRDGRMNPYHGKITDCRAIPKNRATKYATNYSITRNELVRPAPFSGQCWIIQDALPYDCDAIPGLVGQLVVGYPEDGERFYC